MMVKIAFLLAFAAMVAAKGVEPLDLDLDLDLDRDDVMHCKLGCEIKENAEFEFDLDLAIDLCLDNKYKNRNPNLLCKILIKPSNDQMIWRVFETYDPEPFF